ncbi:MAG TPA: MltA domain-containing protein [Roseiarcus sp.]
MVGHDFSLEPLAFEALAGFDEDDLSAAFGVFARSARAIAEDAAPLRAARLASEGLRRAAAEALAAPAHDAGAARRFLTTHFRPFRVRPSSGRGFLTGYYEPWVRGSAAPTPDFTAPILARPADLVTAPAGAARFDPAATGARRLADGSLVPFPDRAAIEAEASSPLLWLADAVEVFLVQVQGSARVELTDGRRVRLVYDGRNGLPYTSIGRLLIESGEIAEAEMSLARLKSWLRANGLSPGGRARALMQRNRSYVFFRLEVGFDPEDGPIGGAGIPLTPLRSIAVDRSIWSYGTPFWIDASLPWQGEAPTPFRRLTIAADTGSAILGPARADIFFGGGDAAGARAGAIRHPADFVVLLPTEDKA